MSFEMKQILATLGGLSLLITIYKVASFVLLYTRPSRFGRYQPKNGETAWALVTGSSDGIGKAFAKEFASRGFNVIIHGRNTEKLDTLQRELEAAFPKQQFRKLVLDASDPSVLHDSNTLSAISDCVPLKVLVNNVGCLPPGNQLGSLEEISAENLSTNVTINAVFPLLFTKAVYPMLKASQPSLVLSVGSFADIGMPVFPAYAPSKSFLMTSSTELGLEAKVAGTDIEFLGLRIMQVTGTQVVQLPTSFMVPDTDTWVKLSLARVGCGRRSVVPHWPQGVHDAMWKTLPWWMIQKLLITISKQIQADNMGRSGADAEKKDL